MVAVLGGSVPCDSASHVRTVRVTVDADAPAGEIPFTLAGSGSDASVCFANGSATVVMPDLAFDGLAEEDEEDPGGLLWVNGPHPLPALTLQVNGASEGTACLQVTGGEGFIQMYEDADGTIPVMLFNECWDVSQLPITRYLEGIASRESRGDVEVRLTYETPGGTCEDIVKLKVVELDLAIHNGGSDLDHGDAVGAPGALVPEEDEEDVGAYILVNWDDDDGDGAMNPDGSWSSDPVPDVFETAVQNEDNLAKLALSLDPLPSNGTVELETTGYGSQIRIWSTNTKGTEINPSGYPWEFDLADPGERSQFQQIATDGLWVEGYGASAQERDVVFVLRFKDTSGQELCSDTVKATVVMINLGNAVYREGQIAGISGRGHAALVWKFVGPLTRANLEDDEKFLIIHMQRGGLVDTHNLTMITQSSGEAPWGCYTNPDVTYVHRLKLLQAAKSLVAREPGISYTGFNAALGNNDPEDPKDWDGKLSTIAELRCDGLIEVCYEINGVEVWGMVRTPDGGVVHYDISDVTDEWSYHETTGGWDHEPNGWPDNLEEHNDFDSPDWADTLMPATQCAHVTPEDADTKFQQQNLCIPVGSEGGN
jgi:hypothetical protein